MQQAFCVPRKCRSRICEPGFLGTKLRKQKFQQQHTDTYNRKSKKAHGTKQQGKETTHNDNRRNADTKSHIKLY